MSGVMRYQKQNPDREVNKRRKQAQGAWGGSKHYCPMCPLAFLNEELYKAHYKENHVKVVRHA